MWIWLLILVVCILFWEATCFPIEYESFSEFLDYHRVWFLDQHYYMHKKFRKLYKKFCRRFEKTKSFEKYLDLPPSLRMMVIDQMRAKDRCRFTRCSKLSAEEAKASHNYINSLEMFANHENRIVIFIGHDKGKTSISLIFVKENGKQWMEYGSSCKDLWREELDDSVDLVEHAAEHFKKLLNEYQNKIKYLSFQGELFETKLKDYDYGIESLNNVNDLNLHSEMDVPLFFSKLQHPLRHFFINGKNDSFLNECSQVYQVREDISICQAKLTNEQFQRLSASNVHMNIGYLSELDIFNFVQSWENETIGKEVKRYQWDNLESSNFDLYKLFDLFDVQFNLFEKVTAIEIEQDKEDGKSAKLSYCNYKYYKYLEFKVVDMDQEDESDIE